MMRPIVLSYKSRIVGTFVFLATLTLYLLTAWMTGSVRSPIQAYFNDLAAAFITGRLDLVNPLSTLDLTFYNGKWYVPFPPLPALLMIPWALSVVC